MKTTVIEIKQMLDLLPDDMPVQIRAQGDTVTGIERIGEIVFFKDSGSNYALPSEDGAYAVIYTSEGYRTPREMPDEEDDEPVEYDAE